MGGYRAREAEYGGLAVGSRREGAMGMSSSRFTERACKEDTDYQADLLKLTRINFSESYQLLAHLKTIRLFVESVLRYGLPADYAGVIVRVSGIKTFITIIMRD
jgi:hypothetical protein